MAKITAPDLERALDGFLRSDKRVVELFKAGSDGGIEDRLELLEIRMESIGTLVIALLKFATQEIENGD